MLNGLLKKYISLGLLILGLVVGALSSYWYMCRQQALVTVTESDSIGRCEKNNVNIDYPIIWHGPRDSNQVAITFDDGPNPMYTPQILEILAKHNVKATFFVVGEMVESYQDVVKRVVREGHEIGSHTMTHPMAPREISEQLNREVVKANRLITKISGKQVRFFRPPYGYFDVAYFNSCRNIGNNVVLWSIVPKDWEQPPAKVLAQRVLSAVEPGSIILLHDGGGNRQETVKALSLILEGLKEKNLTAVTVSQLVK